MNWEDEIRIMINEWVKRLIRFGHLKEIKQSEGGFTIYECPELNPYIQKLLENIIGENDKCLNSLGENYGYLCSSHDRNILRKEQRKRAGISS